ncbi:DEAD/DEAH box helicase [Flavicella marina]|uniref:DEAD/DEAH box helicase n=1 Tax=Flavicella marina TaxID=1475951 RepID=UPI001264B289|nr:AAA domain-containing protein [Flavicella marina]
MNNIKNWIHYYRNSLFDSENLAVDISRIKNLFHQNNCDLSLGSITSKNAKTLLDSEERRINRLRGINKKDSPSWQEINDTEIIIAPFELVLQSSSKKEAIHPFWIKARINRSGQLSAPKDLFPIVVRNYIDPIADVGNDFIFSTMDLIEGAREIEIPYPLEDAEEITWSAYWDYLNELFNKIAFSNIDFYRADGFRTDFKVTYFAKSSKIATAKSILFLYENILNETEEFPLISKLVTPIDRDRKEPIADDGFLQYNHLHLGQMTDKFPLSISQRKTLLSYLTAETNSITAVNGPPGTGKTTLLQSLVATEVVRAAIKGEEAPVILACSTNNQAVTNIIDSFINADSSVAGLSERWIPQFHGYATYLPSGSKSEKALKNINYLKGNLFGYQGTLCDLENETYVYDAETYFFDKYHEYFGFHADSLEDACLHLQEEISVVEDNLINGVSISRDFIKAIDTINQMTNNPADYLSKEKLNVVKVQQWRKAATAIKSAIDTDLFQAEFQKLFTIESDGKSPFFASKEILENTDSTKSFIKNTINLFNTVLNSYSRLKEWKQLNNIKGFPLVSEEEMWNHEYEKLDSDDKSHRFFYDEIDVSLRHKAFLLAIHYWEARWILATLDAIEHETEKGTGEKAIQDKWKRRAMLTPCFVATFYMAPTHFVYSQFQGENEDGNPLFEYLPLYNFLDLLIIDEAGQVTPEVSIPVFSLAKKAIVVGDLKQIEPIWMIPSRIDSGNLMDQNITDNASDANFLHNLGFLASSGSIMKMAQNACEFETPLITDKEKGLLLLEHRRCNDEIIGFCNELAYGGILKPMKGKAKADQLFPSMMAYHIEGKSDRKFSSRFNITEVNAIVSWLNQHKEAIAHAYDTDTVESVLGIITPFTSQKSELSRALTEAGYNVSKMKLGTVHALQGAERNIVLFSSVYTTTDEGTLFFDRDNKPNMLNVAVSRARDSFILFGDTRVFDENNSTPSGILKKHLQVHDLAH